ncbi:MAG: glycoside hydrolase family 88 protein [Symbiopectobacterium sp.]
MVDHQDASYQMILNTFRRQADAAVCYQDTSGMWRTLLNQPDSYLEASRTSGFTYVLLKGIRLGLLDERYHDTAWKGVDALLSRIGPPLGFFHPAYRAIYGVKACSAYGGNNPAFQRCCQLCAKVCIPL